MAHNRRKEEIGDLSVQKEREHWCRVVITDYVIVSYWKEVESLFGERSHLKSFFQAKFPLISNLLLNSHYFTISVLFFRLILEMRQMFFGIYTMITVCHKNS